MKECAIVFADVSRGLIVVAPAGPGEEAFFDRGLLALSEALSYESYRVDRTLFQEIEDVDLKQAVDVFLEGYFA